MKVTRKGITETLEGLMTMTVGQSSRTAPDLPVRP